MMSRVCFPMRGMFGLLFLTAALWAEAPREDVFNYPLGPRTRDAFTLTCARLAEHPFVKGQFEQEKTLSRLNRSLKSSGNFIIAAEQGMVWETLKPFPSTLALGKDYLVQSRPGGQKTVLSAAGNETFIRMAEVLNAVFSGNSQGLLENFDVYYAGGVSGWKLGLVPLDKAIASFAVTIIMSGDSVIRTMVINEQNGDSVSYLLSNHNYPADLDANEKALFTVP